MAIATVGGLAVALVTLPASAHDYSKSTVSEWYGTTTNGKNTCSTNDKPEAPDHWSLETAVGATGDSSFHKLKVWSVTRVGNTYYDKDVDTFGSTNPLKDTVFGYCNSQKSVEVWFTTAAGSSDSDKTNASNLLDKYTPASTDANRKDAQNPHADDSAIKKWQYNKIIPQGYSFGSTIMYYTTGPAITFQEFTADRWVCAIVRVNSGRVTKTITTITGPEVRAVASGYAVSDADGPSAKNQRGDFSKPLCVLTNASDSKQLKNSWDHNCDRDDDGISGEVEDADVRSRTTNAQGDSFVLNTTDGKLTKDDLDAYKCTPHPCDIVNPTPSSSYGFNIDDLNTDGSTNNGFATLDDDDASAALCRTLCDRRSATSPTNRYTTPPSTPGADGNVNYADGDANGDGNITRSDLNARPAYQWTRCGMNKREAELGRALEWWED